MKPIDQFISQMMESARLVQNKDVSSATAVIQQALAQAGLVPPQAVPAAQERAAFVDLNPPPQGAATGKAGPRARASGWRKPAQAPQAAPRGPSEQAPGSFVAGSFASAFGTRRYKLYIPARAASGPRPLVVMLHGCTQNPDDFARGTAMNALAEQHGCLVLYPEQDRSANHSQCWNWFETGHQGRGAGEPELLAGMTRQVVIEHGADPGRVFVAGLSAGGAMAAILAAEYPELYAAAGIHSGLAAGCARDMITGLQAMKKPGRGRTLRQGVPVIVFHGDADHVVNPANGEAALQQFVGVLALAEGGQLRRSSEQHSEGGRRVTRDVWRDGEGRALAEHWVLHGAGHAWAGGDASGSHTDATGPSASREMLRFFLGQAPVA